MDVTMALSAFLDDLRDDDGTPLASAFEDAAGAAPDSGAAALVRLRARLDEIYLSNGWEPPPLPGADDVAALESDELDVGATASVDEDRAVWRARARSAMSASQEVRREATAARDHIEALRAEVHHMRTALRSRAVIEQAKGMVMERYAISAEAAWQFLVRRSQTENVKVRDLAEALVAKASAGEQAFT